MKILFIAETVPYPPDNGGRIKTYYTLKGLSQRHEVHLVCFAREEKQFAYQQPLEEVCERAHLLHLPRTKTKELGYALAGMTGPMGYVMRRHVDRGAMARIRDLFHEGGFDAVYSDHLSMAAYGLALEAHRILDEHNVEYRIIERFARTEGLSPKGILGKLEWRKLRRYESSVLRRMDHVLAVTGEDARVLGEMAGNGTRISVVPIGFDTDKVDFSAEPFPRANMILSVGTLYWPPNIDAAFWFHSKVLPLIRQQNPEVEVVLAGAKPPKRIQDMAKENVKVPGYVDDADLRALYHRAGACIVPLRSGSGMRVKILEALSYGTPVVSTRVGCEGIEVTDGEDILIADEPAEFAAAVIRVLSDPDLAARLSRKGRALMERTYAWPRVWETLHETLPAEAPAPDGRAKLAEAGA